MNQHNNLNAGAAVAEASSAPRPPRPNSEYWDDAETLWTERQAARYLNVHWRTAQNWRLTGTGPPFRRLSPKCVRYVKRDLDEWLEARRFASTSEYAA